jgi:hypothetical protein
MASLLRALLLLLLLLDGRTMPALCQNGWPVLTSAQCVVYQIGEVVKVRLAPGAPGELLADFARWFDDNIRDLDPGILDDWGWADRPVRGGTDTSNHAGGYAVDLNATKWSLGSAASIYLTQAEIDRVHAKLREYGGVLRWGADYEGRTDPMHVEVIGTPAQVQAVWDRIRGAVAPPIVPAASVTPHPAGRPVIQKGAKGQAVKDLQLKLKTAYPLYAKNLVVDGDFGAKTDAAVREFQRRSGLVVDGIVGPRTWAKLGL